MMYRFSGYPVMIGDVSSGNVQSSKKHAFIDFDFVLAYTQNRKMH